VRLVHPLEPGAPLFEEFEVARVVDVPIIYEDERLSTISAIRTLTIQKVKTGKNRELVDMQAAAIILQRFLDRNESPPSA